MACALDRSRGGRTPEASGSALLSDASWSAVAESFRLTAREAEITRCVFNGLDEAAIARACGLSAHTVNTYFQRLYRKLGVSGREQLVLLVIARHLKR